MRHLKSAGMLLIAAAASAIAVPGSAADSLTIYSSGNRSAMAQPSGVGGLAVVRQEHEFTLSQAHDTVRLVGVAARIDPTTVTFHSLTDPSTRVTEQRYRYDMARGSSLLNRYLGRTVTVDQIRGNQVVSTTGTLLSTHDGVVLRDADGGIQLIRRYANLHLPPPAVALVTQPTLVWKVAASHPGPKRVRVSYQTAGMNWWADYILRYRDDGDDGRCSADLDAWVSVANQSGASYKGAQLKLVAGDIHRAKQVMPIARRAMAAAESGISSAGFQQKSLFEYHLYTLGHRITLPDDTTTQVEFMPTAKAIPCAKRWVYHGYTPRYRGTSGRPLLDQNPAPQPDAGVKVYLEFRNDKASHLGLPLPAGLVRVNKVDNKAGDEEFIGEDRIGPTPKDEPIRLQVGNAFDVVGARKQLAFHIDSAHKRVDEEIEITLRNHKPRPISIMVVESLYRTADWAIIKSNHEFQKTDAGTIQFPTTVGADKKVTVRYTVRYSW